MEFVVDFVFYVGNFKGWDVVGGGCKGNSESGELNYVWSCCEDKEGCW